MVIKQLGSFLIKNVADLSLKPAIELLETFLMNEEAFAFARERLRAKYQDLVSPASYEHVVSNLRLTKQDFIEYFRANDKPSYESLNEYLKCQLRKRSLDWVYNKPSDELFSRLLDDFYNAYESYFITADPKLATLHLVDLSSEVLTRVTEIRNTINAIVQKSPHVDSSFKNFADDVSVFLVALNIPFEVVNKTSEHFEAIIIDPSSIFPARFYLCAAYSLKDTEMVDEIIIRSQRYGRLSHFLLVTECPIDVSLAAYLDRHSIIYLSLKEFRAELLKISSNEKYIIGSLGGQNLLEVFNIHEVYIPPDCVPAQPGDKMEDKFLDVRIPALNVITDFIADKDEKILFVFGGYGSGKSALCAYLTKYFSSQGFAYIPVYISLRQLRNAEDLSRIVTKGDQLSRVIANEQKKHTMLILDGLDELPNAMDVNEKRFNMLRLLQAASRTDKMIVTVRTSYFRGLHDFWDLFARKEDNKLWREMAKYIPETGLRPKISAIILREFDNRQIEFYVKKFGEARGESPDFVVEFFASMKAHDPHGIYRMLARNPLYLFLLVNSQPWNHSGVACFADVLEIFIHYWLERDIEKGPSRWLLTIQDRKDFISEIAWWMFNQGKVSISFQEFDAFVTRYYGRSIDKEEIASISLDLQTTGIFTCIGQSLFFALPDFMDYFVALEFFEGKMPKKLPRPKQARLWLGMAETRKRNPYSDMNRERLNAWLAEREISIDKDSPEILNIDPKGIIYGELPEGWNWPFVNNEYNVILRAIIAGAFKAKKATQGYKEVMVRVVNGLGIHARPGAFIVHAFQEWMSKFEPDNAPVVTFEYGGDRVNPLSIIGLITLGITADSTFKIVYNCEDDRIEEFLRSISGVPESEAFAYWKTDFKKAYIEEE